MEKGKYELRMQLDDYGEIFSDFDPRSYSERSLSDDFISEAKRAAIDREEEIDLLLFIPKLKRNEEQERMIKKRLLAHFKRHSLLLKGEAKKHRFLGFRFIGIGITLMVLATFYLYKFQ